jgi:zinc/manganese transport system permease protein
MGRRRLPSGYAIGALGYALGLLASLRFDLPSGPMIVCAVALCGALVFAITPRRAAA